jgi:glycosyltransferase involved in cell wall biosynthesis
VKILLKMRLVSTMNILYLHQYYNTNASSGGTRSYEFAKYLSESGFKVNVITGTEVDRSYNGAKDKVNVYSTSTKYSNKMSKWRRIIAFFDYIVKALFKGLKTKNVDIVFATSTPLTIGIPAVLISKLLRKKLIFEVRDVWPDVPIQLGYIKNKFVVMILKKLEFWIYKNSKHIIVLSEGMYKNLINKGIPAQKLSVIENMSNLYLYDRAGNFKWESNLEGSFVCIHPGTMGHVNGLDFVLDVAKEMIHVDKDVIFLLIGEGNRKEQLITRVKEEGLTNVLIRDALPKAEIVKVIKHSDVGIMCVDNKYKILEDNSANKFFDFLAAGLPILINYEGWQQKVIEESNCGRSNLNPIEMVNTILEIKRNTQLKEEMSNNSRKLAEEKYSDLIAKEKFLNVIKNI